MQLTIPVLVGQGGISEKGESAIDVSVSLALQNNINFASSKFQKKQRNIYRIS